MGKADGFENLEAWKSAREVRKFVALMTKKFPPHEIFSLTQQVTNSSRSISANISEGYGRYHTKDNTKHCRIARGSLTETLDHMIEARDEGYINDVELFDFRQKYAHCLKLINGYVKYLNDQMNIRLQGQANYLNTPIPKSPADSSLSPNLYLCP